MKNDKIIHRIILSILLFGIISLLSIYSSINITSSSMGNIFVKQLIYYFLGIILLLIGYYKKKEIFKYHYLGYITFIFLLILILFLGISINGSRCWLIIGPISFQPSEFMKIFLIITLSKILEKTKKESVLLFKCFIVFLIPAMLTFLEPDTGVVIIYFIITFSMIVFRGINKKWYIIFLTILSIIGGGITLLYFFKRELLLNILGNNIYYRIERILNWSGKTGYQLENSLIAIGSSGLFGFGFNKVPLYYPEASTDFIFTTFTTCFGLIGSIILIVIIITFDLSILSIIKDKISKRNKYVIIGIFTMILYQQIQNISMTIGLLPITGITLPFISYGGSSLLSYMFITGILLRISVDANKYIN